MRWVHGRGRASAITKIPLICQGACCGVGENSGGAQRNGGVAGEPGHQGGHGKLGHYRVMVGRPRVNIKFRVKMDNVHGHGRIRQQVVTYQNMV